MVTIRRRTGAAVLAVLAAGALCATVALRGSAQRASDLVAAGERRRGVGWSRHARLQSTRAYPEVASFLQPLHSEPGPEQEGTVSFNGPGSFGSDKVFPDRQVFHSNAVFGSNNHFGELSHFKAGTHFEEGNTFSPGASFGTDTHFGANNHFGADTTIGKESVIGAGAVFGDGSVMGEKSVFGPGVTVGGRSFIAGNQVLAGGDHFGAHSSFGPNIRFGPNTEFDGDELFAVGSSFGDSTKFDLASAGHDTFGGGHSFGVNTHWGANMAQVTDGGPIRDDSAGKAGVDQSVIVGLPPGYQPTSIPGVYQYSAAPAKVQPVQKQHDADVDWTASQVQSGSDLGLQWHKIGLSSPSTPRPLLHHTPAALPQRYMQKRVATNGRGEHWESRRISRAAAAAAGAAAQRGAAAGAAAAKLRLSHASRASSHPQPHFGTGMAAWLEAHAQHFSSGPSTLAAAAAAASDTKQLHDKKVSANKAASSFHKLDGLDDRKEPVAVVKAGTAAPISFFSMFE